MNVKVTVFAVLFWFACAIALLIFSNTYESPVQSDEGQDNVELEASVVESNQEIARYMRHVILAFVAFVPALGVCAAFIGSRSSAKKGEEDKEARPVFKGTLKSVSIEEKVKQPTTT